MSPRVQALVGWGRRYFSFTLLAILGYLAFLLFFNDNSVDRTLRLDHTIDSLRQELSQAADTLARYQELNRRLSTDPAEMERVAREHYNMNRPGEDVYVFK